MTVGIVDYGMGNLLSVKRAIEELGETALFVDDPQEIKSLSHLILPGVGAFSDGMAHLKTQGWDQALSQWVNDEQMPLLGICLGMQLLADWSNEGSLTSGLGLIPGGVNRLESSENERVPHVGWNEVDGGSESLLQGIPSGTDFYFVHSYHFTPDHDDDVCATTPYCGKFVSVVNRGTAWGVQFHPEKSSKPGLALLKNFIDL